MELIKKRYSCKRFKSETVDIEIINNIIDSGRLAPSAKNRQPWRFITISDPDVKKIINEACYGAEVITSADKIIAICTTNINYVMPNGQDAHSIDLGIATSFMLLQAEYEGLGACVVTTYNEEPIRKVLTVPFSMRVYCLLAIGYKDSIEQTVNERKSFEDVHNWEHW